jgi:hypothetical protein
MDPERRVSRADRRAGRSPDGQATPVRIAYLMNYYPAVAHTFILRELQALDPAKVEPFRVATNPVSADGLLTDLERDEFARTYNIQNSPGCWRPRSAAIRSGS